MPKTKLNPRAVERKPREVKSKSITPDTIREQLASGENGRFGCLYGEPLAKPLGIRIPESSFNKLSEILTGREKTEFLRNALVNAIAKLEE